MITQNTEKENPSVEINSKFIAAEKELGIASLLKKCNIRKQSRKLAGALHLRYSSSSCCLFLKGATCSISPVQRNRTLQLKEYVLPLPC